jgi:hypothetical protein
MLIIQSLRNIERKGEDSESTKQTETKIHLVNVVEAGVARNLLLVACLTC